MQTEFIRENAESKTTQATQLLLNPTKMVPNHKRKGKERGKQLEFD
jgi:hypothetical protein